MAKKEKYATLISNIVELIGGKDNIVFFTHCVTRLRFGVKDQSLVKEKDIEQLEGVVGCQWSSGQYQVIIGQAVAEVYQMICKTYDLAQTDAIKENLDKKNDTKLTPKTILNNVVGAISASVVPCIPILMGGGFIKILLIILSMSAVISETDDLYLILNFVGNAAFYFLPIYVGSNAAKKFNANQGLGMLMGAILIEPNFIALVSDGSTQLSFLGIPVLMANYASTILPVIMIVWMMSYVEKFITKISPEVIRSIIVPFLTILIMLPLALCLIAPLGSYLGDYIGAFFMWMYDTTGFFGLGILCSVYPLLVLAGMHWTLMPIGIGNLAALGYDTFLIGINFVNNLNQGAACLAVAAKAKNKNLKRTAGSVSVSAILAGITEPAMFGITLKLKKPFLAVMVGNFVGGAMCGLLHVYAYAMTTAPGLLSLPVFIGGERGFTNILFILISLLVGMLATFAITYVLGFDEETNAE